MAGEALADVATLRARAASDGAVFRRVVAEGYDRCADDYLARHAQNDADDMRQGPWQAVAATLAPGAHVLDLGCGAGVPVAKAIVEDPRQLRVTGVDISSRQIELARELVPSPRAAFICSDMSAVCFDAGSFDAIFAFFSIFHLPRREHGDFFKRVAAWLRPGASFIFNMDAGDGEGDASFTTDFLGATMAWSSNSRHETVALLAAAGLGVVEEDVKRVTQGDAVDEAGLGFRFYTCVKTGVVDTDLAGGAMDP